MNEQEIVRIAKNVAGANNVNFSDVLAAPITDSTGEAAIEIKFVLPQGSSGSVMGLSSANTVSQIVRILADGDEKRFPIIRFEESDE